MHWVGDPGQAPTGIRTQAPSMKGGRLTNWAIPPLYPQNSATNMFVKLLIVNIFSQFNKQHIISDL